MHQCSNITGEVCNDRWPVHLRWRLLPHQEPPGRHCLGEVDEGGCCAVHDFPEHRHTRSQLCDPWRLRRMHQICTCTEVQSLLLLPGAMPPPPLYPSPEEIHQEHATHAHNLPPVVLPKCLQLQRQHTVQPAPWLAHRIQHPFGASRQSAGHQLSRLCRCISS
jgi:hypothetical protein